MKFIKLSDRKQTTKLKNGKQDIWTLGLSTVRFIVIGSVITEILFLFGS